MHLKYYFSVFLLFILFCAPRLNAGKVEIEFLSVGQGNFVTVKAIQPDKDPQYLLVDVGTSSYKKELKFTEMQSPVKEKEEKETETLPSTPEPQQSFMSLGIPESILKPIFQRRVVEEEEYGEEGKEKSNADIEFIQSVRKKLPIRVEAEKQLEEKKEQEYEEKIPPIYVQTVVITHPDKDHYGWLTSLFDEDKDHIGYLIFGGLPEQYDLSGKMKFKEWIVKRLRNKSQIYFPAIQYEPITSLEEILEKSKTIKADHYYSDPKSDVKKFKEAFDFGEGINIHLLSVNPTHFPGKSGILRLADSEDTNVDSLVLKIENGKSSAILTGDATGITTTRILDNYYDQLDFLKANIFLAGHHGSASHESNNKTWIQAISPQFVVISNGLLHGHPHEKAYENFKVSSRLKRVEKHKVLVPISKTKGFIHLTSRAIYSTLSNGTINVQLEEDGNVKVNTEKEGEIRVHFPTLLELALEKVIQHYSSFKRNEVEEFLPKFKSSTGFQISQEIINLILFNLPKEIDIQETESVAAIVPFSTQPLSKSPEKSLFSKEKESKQEEGQTTPLKSKKKKKRSGEDEEELKKKKIKKKKTNR